MNYLHHYEALGEWYNGIHVQQHRPLSPRLDRCDRVIQDEVCDSNGGNV